MPDPKMLAFADYLRKNYRGAAKGQVSPESLPRMTDDQNRTAAFVRGAPAPLPVAMKAMKRQRALASALMQPTGGRSGRATRMSMTPVDD